jgi:hypothetical protein
VLKVCADCALATTSSCDAFPTSLWSSSERPVNAFLNGHVLPTHVHQHTAVLPLRALHSSRTLCSFMTTVSGAAMQASSLKESIVFGSRCSPS